MITIKRYKKILPLLIGCFLTGHSLLIQASNNRSQQLTHDHQIIANDNHADSTLVNDDALQSEPQQLTAIDRSRTITVKFITTHDNNMPWYFFPKIHSMRLHPGEIKKFAYYAKNNADHTMSVKAVTNITPVRAAQYMTNSHLSWREPQALDSMQQRDMPISISIDNHLPTDIDTINIAYTLVEVPMMTEQDA